MSSSPSHSPARRTQLLRNRAEELGFDAFGVAEAQRSDHESRLRAWLDRGFHGDMDWMETTYERRTNVFESVPDARSVVAVSASYYRPGTTSDGPLKVARYAQGKDYHRWFRRKLRKLRKHLLLLDPEAVVYPTVDTSPVLEREWAAKAGIAWIGKSTMAIHPQLGTYTFLGTLITSSTLIPNDPIPNRCGSCSACLDQCPTQAFVEPGVLDARKCISYWTLETRGDLPPEAPPFHGWAAGCDVCQQVCPWNKFARVSEDPHTLPSPELSHPDPSIFTDPLQHDTLEEILSPTALKRNGAENIRRNAHRSLGIHITDTNKFK